MQVRKVSSPVFTALSDGTGVLLNIETLLYFGLNRTGAALWLEIDRAGATTLEDLMKCVGERFDVDQRLAEADISRFVANLARLGLVQLF